MIRCWYIKYFACSLKKISYVVDNEVVKNTKFNTLKTKLNNLDKKIPDATTLTHINHYKTNKNWRC